MYSPFGLGSLDIAVGFSKAFEPAIASSSSCAALAAPRRAKAAANYLTSQGLDTGRFTLISFGKERPVCTEKAEACWAKNRHDRFLAKPR